MIRALFLDLDGTLADSLPAMIEVFHAFLARYGLTANDGDFDRFNGPTLRQVVETLRTERGIPGDADALYREYLSFVDDAYAHRVRANEGSAELIRFAKSNGLTLGLVTANHPGAASMFMKAQGLAHAFDFTVTADDEPVGKPDPAVYRLAAQMANLADPADALAVEDSANGVRASVAAGVPVVHFAPGDAAPLPGAIARVRALADVIPILRERLDA